MNNATKRRWITALSKLYNQYVHEIYLGTSHDVYTCSLCILDDKLSKESGVGADCNLCIHLNKEFGQGTHCTKQASYKQSDAPNNWMNYRKSYILRMQRKLVKSLTPDS